jgi:hypothetical protein
LQAYAGGYRGCALDDRSYFFLQCSPKRGVRRLFSYPKDDFEDISHFKAMMQKFISPPQFLHPTVQVPDLTTDVLDQAYRQIKSRKT